MRELIDNFGNYSTNVMTIEYLTNSIEKAARAKGYEFASAAKEYLPSQVATLPAAFMLPPEFRAIEGRKSGKITYRITLYLLAKGAHIAPAKREQLLEKLENDAFGIFSRLSAEQRVLAVEDMTLAPLSKPLTSRGDVAIKGEGNVVVSF